MPRRRLSCLALFLVGGLLAAAPATRPSDDQILAMIVQLGDPVAARRDDAEKALRAMGDAALPRLRQAAAGGLPEIAVRSKAIIEAAQTPSIPGGPLGNELFQKISVAIGAHGRTIEATSTSGRKFSLRDGPDGAELTVAAIVDGREVTQTTSAASLDALRQTDPLVSNIIDHMLGSGGAGIGMLNARGGIVVLGAIGGSQDAFLNALAESLQGQMNAAQVAPEARAQISGDIEELKSLMRDDPHASDEARDQSLLAYFEKSDQLRQKLAELKLDPGDFLPPPAKTRLGIQFDTHVPVGRDGKSPLMVETVAPGSRAAKLGLRPGDVVLEANGKPVDGVPALRDITSSTPAGLTITVLRGDQKQELAEK